MWKTNIESEIVFFLQSEKNKRKYFNVNRLQSQFLSL